MKIGVLSIQGDVSEHLSIVEKTLKEMGIKGNAVPVKKNLRIDALIIPGGESTAIFRIMKKMGLSDKIKKLSIPVMGTCAGCVLMDRKHLGLMDMDVERNAFGRQKESFEADIKIKGFKESYHGVFIRAPVITNVYGECKILAKFENRIVMAQEDNKIALSFHPELTDDTRIHKYFLSLIKNRRNHTNCTKFRTIF
ncbi:MAG: pyridoxal 5'-phosphate synthase glutaminase subunit PdxT [Thermoplasmatales archaeon]|nr:pyridoxal 5'-phosphate synthase glutaminase subunit PdxT [Candidatus Thermoplasmatota archaeon]MCG2827150.1 pyridoxal 5'-phosphate synthase glutaminase subunit PdxT [Thermoplasmatales archaeon]